MKYIILIAIVLVCYFFPKEYNAYFSKKYHEEILSTPMAALTAVIAIAWTFSLDVKGFWYWLLLIALILLCLTYIALIIIRGTYLGANPFEILVAALAQIIFAAGIFIFIIFVIGMLLGGKKKRRRR